MISAAGDDIDMKKQEESIMELGSQLAKEKKTQELREMIEKVNADNLSNNCFCWRHSFFKI